MTQTTLTQPTRTINRSIRFVSTAMLILCGFSLAACDDNTDPGAPPPATLTGNWGSPNYSFSSFALTEANGNVTGHGWFGGGIPVAVNGTLTGDRVALTLTLRTRKNAAPLQFQGVFANNALVGNIGATGEEPANLTRSSMTRVDTVAESIGQLTFSDGRAAITDFATFFWTGRSFAINPVAVFSNEILLFGSSDKLGPGKLAPGKYTIGPNTPFQGRVYDYPATSGEVTITKVASKMITGSFTMTATVGTSPLTVTGSFSASCPYDDLYKDGLHCAPN